MSTISREELTKRLQVKFPDVIFKTTEEFNGETGGVWVTSYDGQMYYSNPLFSYYSQKAFFECGVNKKLVKFLSSLGWYAQFHDPETVMFWQA